MRSTTFKNHFPKKPKVFLAVIHLRDRPGEPERNITAAVRGGADGILLINQDSSSNIGHVMEIARKAHEERPALWIGINCLGYGNIFLHKLPDYIKGVWIDNADINEDIPAEQQSKEILTAIKDWPGCYFGGVAFKYQSPVKSFTNAAKAAIGNMDVITTSGPGTGEAADINKIKEMKEAIGTYPLALASGVTPSNIDTYLPYVDCFIIGTYLEVAPFNISEGKVSNIKNKIIGLT